MVAGVPRPPPMRIPSNLPALQQQSMRQQTSRQPGGAEEMSPKGTARGTDNSGIKKPARFSYAASGDSGGAGTMSINVYVGKLKPEVDNTLVEELLSCCGRVEKWNRAVDPSTDLPKAFGFCTYRIAQAAAVAVQACVFVSSVCIKESLWFCESKRVFCSRNKCHGG